MIFEMITSVDTAILDFFQHTLRCGFLDLAMAFFSFIGNSGAVWITASLVLLLFRRTRAMGTMALFAVIIGFLIGEVGLKNLICRPRPFVADPGFALSIAPPSGYSFPSGHSCSSFAFATVALKCDKRIGVPAVILAVLIAFSRLYNYVHYPSDVICGILLGIGCAFFTVYIFRRIGKEDKGYE